MDKTAKFQVTLSDKDRIDFANLSGDFNPLHVDDDYTEGTNFKKCVLHGAFSAGLISKMAGMHLPGTKCLLHSMELNFINPIYTPAKLDVEGVITKDSGENGQVNVVIRDANNGERLVEGSYKFGRHISDVGHTDIKPRDESISTSELSRPESKVLITGASGGLGSSLIEQLDSEVIGLSRDKKEGLTCLEDIENISFLEDIGSLSAIVHCAWPQPINEPLLELGSGIKLQTEYHLAKPIRECIALAKLLKEKGVPGAKLILIGSTFSNPGRHAWSFPFYSLAKSLIPTLVKILSLELGASGHKVIGVNFDMLEGGMNSTVSKAAKIAAIDRSPIGKIPSVHEAATDIKWVLDNAGSLISGAVIELSGGNIP